MSRRDAWRWPRCVGVRSRCAALALFLFGAFGASEVRADQPGDPSFPAIDTKKSPDETFETTALGIIRLGDSGWRPYRGKYRSSMSQEDFLVTIGRQDLASKMRSERASASLLSYGGGAAMLTGLVFLLADASPGGFEPPVALSLGLAVGGLGCWIASDFVEGPVATQAELDEWADRYNAELRARIQKAHSAPASPGSVALAPFAGLRGEVGFSLAGRF